jgi:hypothetical protein
VNILIFMILNDFCLLSAWFCYVIIHVWHMESHMHVSNWCAFRKIANGIERVLRWDCWCNPLALFKIFAETIHILCCVSTLTLLPRKQFVVAWQSVVGSWILNDDEIYMTREADLSKFTSLPWGP